MIIFKLFTFVASLQILRVQGGIAELISNYARVRTNVVGQQRQHEITTARASLSSTVPNKIEIVKQMEKSPEYDDFDDAEEVTREVKTVTTVQTFIKLFNGLVSILAMLYKFNGSPHGSTEQKTHFKQEPRQQNSIANYVNELVAANTMQTNKYQHKNAEDRYLPGGYNTYYNKKQTAGASKDQFDKPLSIYPPYDPNAEGGNGYESQKTSYQPGNKPPKETYSFLGQTQYQPNNIHQDAPPSWQQDDANNADVNKYNDAPPSWQQDDANNADVNKYNDAPPSWSDHDSNMVQYHDDSPSSWQQDEAHAHDMADEDRESKRPYSYYFLGRKLWYIPLLFSIYFIIYVGVLILKSVARHKIQFPEKLWNLHEEHHHDHHDHHDDWGHGKHLNYLTDRLTNAINRVKYKYV